MKVTNSASAFFPFKDHFKRALDKDALKKNIKKKNKKQDNEKSTKRIIGYA